MKRGKGEPALENAEPEKVALVGRVVTDYEVWEEAAVLIEGGKILEVSRDASLAREADVIAAYPDSLIVPGFVDLQVNGGFGIDAATEPDRLPELSEKLLATGTTSYLTTVISSPEYLYQDALPDLPRENTVGAEALGIHLEGPFISLGKRGAHAATHIVPPDPAMLGRLMDLGRVRMVTLAPELEGAEELMDLVRERGAVISAGHSDVAFEDAYESFDGGVASVTHLFNAMSEMHHRQPGLPGAAFAHPRVACGLISDGLHVHPEVVGLAFRMLGPDRVYLVTDATAATSAEPGEYALASRTIYRDTNVTRLASGALAGSLLTMDEAFQNILAFTGCTLAEAVRMVSTTPARLIGEGRRKGRLAPGYDADVTILAPDLAVEAVWRGGKRAYEGEPAVRDDDEEAWQ